MSSGSNRSLVYGVVSVMALRRWPSATWLDAIAKMKVPELHPLVVKAVMICNRIAPLDL
eukprot:COSAG02_NODE_2093_length_9852_cov_2.404286_7_plen_59_part_00